VHAALGIAQVFQRALQEFNQQHEASIEQMEEQLRAVEQAPQAVLETVQVLQRAEQEQKQINNYKLSSRKW
jgi:hypothetical protein